MAVLSITLWKTYKTINQFGSHYKHYRNCMLVTCTLTDVDLKAFFERINYILLQIKFLPLFVYRVELRIVQYPRNVYIWLTS
jgi:hypothetical protein